MLLDKIFKHKTNWIHNIDQMQTDRLIKKLQTTQIKEQGTTRLMQQVNTWPNSLNARG
jgi:hypothetical protein